MNLEKGGKDFTPGMIIRNTWVKKPTCNNSRSGSWTEGTYKKKVSNVPSKERCPVFLFGDQDSFHETISASLQGVI